MDFTVAFWLKLVGTCVSNGTSPPVGVNAGVLSSVLYRGGSWSEGLLIGCSPGSMQ